MVYPETSSKSYEDVKCLFIIMEHVETDLKKVLNMADQLDLSEDHLKVIIYNLLCCMNFIHTSNVIHRDLKPANILLDENCRPKICDFGISRTLPRQITQPVVDLSNKQMSNQKVTKIVFKSNGTVTRKK